MSTARPRFIAIALFTAALGAPEAGARQLPPGAVGPKYFVNMTAVNPNTDLTLGTVKMLFDTGASGTTLSREDAQALGFLDAAGNPVGALDSGERTVARNANNQIAGRFAISIGLRLSITGKDKNGMDTGNAVFPTDEKNVVYPLAGQPNVSTLFGTNVIKELPQEQRTPDGGLKYTSAVPFDPRMTIDLASHTPNFYDPITGQPLTNPLVANTLPAIQNTVVGGPANTTMANWVYDTGSPYTIISQSLANSIQAPAVGTFDLFGSDPSTFANLSLEGFLGGTNPGPLTIVDLSSLLLPTESGGPLGFSNVFALVNPVSSVTNNLFGTNVFSNAGLTAIEDFAAGRVEVVPEPGSSGMLACGAGVSLLAWRRARKNAGRSDRGA
jgi:hypothetical protein